MNEQFIRQAQEFSRQAQEIFNAAKDKRIPENVQTLAEESVVKSREGYTKMSAVAKDGAKALEEFMLAAQSGAWTIGKKILEHSTTNAETAFDAAQAIARAKTIPEALGLQASFVQQQLTIGSEQAKDLFELSTKVTQQTLDSLNTAATKTFDQLMKAS